MEPPSDVNLFLPVMPIKKVIVCGMFKNAQMQDARNPEE
jgi:hypothetical protein